MKLARHERCDPPEINTWLLEPDFLHCQPSVLGKIFKQRGNEFFRQQCARAFWPTRWISGLTGFPRSQSVFLLAMPRSSSSDLVVTRLRLHTPLTFDTLVPNAATDTLGFRPGVPTLQRVFANPQRKRCLGGGYEFGIECVLHFVFCYWHSTRQSGSDFSTYRGGACAP